MRNSILLDKMALNNIILKVSLFLLVFSFGCSNSDKAKENAPSSQVEFESARNDFWKEYFATTNEIKASDIFNRSREHTCSFASKHGRDFSNWTGKIGKIRTDQGGDKVTVFKIISDSQELVITYHQVNISRETPLYKIISELSPGDRVVFEFSFSDEAISHNVKECFDETSMTERGSLEEPEFRVQFKNIRKL